MTNERKGTHMVPPSVNSHAEGYSFEITCKDISQLNAMKKVAAPGTIVSVTFLPNEDMATRVAAAAAVRAAGFIPVPHIAARRVPSERELENYLDMLVSQAAVDRVFVIAGDVASPLGPYTDALSVIRSCVLKKYGIAKVGISGYPTGHPTISENVLKEAMRDKVALLSDMGHESWIMTQFAFEAQPILSWLARARSDGYVLPVRVGIAGPTSMKALLRFAAMCGVEMSTKAIAKYGLSIGKLIGSVGPDAILKDIASRLDPDVHGSIGIHFYPFGGLERLKSWITENENMAAVS